MPKVVAYSFLSFVIFNLYFLGYLTIFNSSNFWLMLPFFIIISLTGWATFSSRCSKKIYLSIITSSVIYPVGCSLILGRGSFIENIFSFTHLVSQAFIFSAILFIISTIIYCFKFTPLKKVILGLYTFIYSLIFIILSIDLFVYWQYRFHINSAMLSLFFSSASAEIFELGTSMYLMLSIFILLLIGVVFCLLRFIGKQTKKIRTQRLVGVLILMFVTTLMYNGIHSVARWKFIPSILESVSCLPLSFPASANRIISKLGYEQNEMAQTISKTNKDSHFYYPKHPLQFDTSKVKDHTLPNIIVIFIDAMRSDLLDDDSAMPNTWNFFKNDYKFQKHYSGGNVTSTGTFSLFYSLSGSYWSDATTRVIPPVFMETLEQNEYQFLIYSSTSLISPEFYRNVFSNVKNLRTDTITPRGEYWDWVMNQEFLEFIRSGSVRKPFFTFLFYNALHGWYFPKNGKYGYSPKFTPTANEMNYFLVNNSTDPTPYRNLYKNSAYFIDMLLKDVYKALEDQGLLENSIVILTGDHGQEINDCGLNFWGHNSNFSRYQTNVPFLVKWNTYGLEDTVNQDNNKIITHLSSHHDFVPTILKRVFGCISPISDYSQGQDLFSTDIHPLIPITTYTQKAILDQDEKLLIFDNYGSFKYKTNKLEDLPVDMVSTQKIKEALKVFSSFYIKD